MSYSRQQDLLAGDRTGPTAKRELTSEDPRSDNNHALAKGKRQRPPMHPSALKMQPSQPLSQHGSLSASQTLHSLQANLVSGLRGAKYKSGVRIESPVVDGANNSSMSFPSQLGRQDLKLKHRQDDQDKAKTGGVGSDQAASLSHCKSE